MGDHNDKDKNRILRRVVYQCNQNEDPLDISRKSFGVHKFSKSATNKEYEILNVLEFDSNRKRMSIILRDRETQRCILYCKGADNAIFPKSLDRNNSFYDNCLKSFSENGWRTLVLAFKYLKDEEYEEYKRMIDDATNDVLNRDERLANVYEVIENGLSIIGVTSVEDRLQENVESTLVALRMAGIKIWVLTGDKLETAINISESCKHFSKEMKQYILKNMTNPDEIRERLNSIAHE